MIAENKNRTLEKRDIVHIAILLSIALAIGVYLIATTVLISKDGFLFIKSAQKIAGELGEGQTVKIGTPGYPFLISVVHKFNPLSLSEISIQQWIYSAQITSLLCRLLTLVLLYFLGKIFVGSRNSFWAILILIFLPHPALAGSDALKEWPYLMFLAFSFYILVWGAIKDRVWAFGLAGIGAALGHMIRPECTQIIAYGILWLLLNLFYGKSSLSRRRTLWSLVFLVIGFVIPALPYWEAGYAATPTQFKEFIDYFLSFNFNGGQPVACVTKINGQYVAEIVSGDAFKGLGRIFGGISDNLRYVFVAPLFIGIYHHFRKKAVLEERFFISAFIFLNIAMLVFLYYIRGYISRRHCLPLTTLTIFYVPGGLMLIGNWFVDKYSKIKYEAEALVRKQQIMFFVLLLIGLCCCLPKLLTPMRSEKQGYRIVARWLREHTAKTDIIAVPDLRIGFYAERPAIEIVENGIPGEAAYIVRIIKNHETESPNAPRPLAWYYVDERTKKKKLLIYRHNRKVGTENL